MVQNLNLAVSDPAGQLYVTAVGGTSVISPAWGRRRREKVWNDQLNYSEGAAGGGISQSYLHAGVPAAAGHGSSGQLRYGLCVMQAVTAAKSRTSPPTPIRAPGYIVYDSR